MSLNSNIGKKADSYAGTKVINHTSANNFDELINLSDIQKKLGNDIISSNMQNKICVVCINGDWNANNTKITYVAIQPKAQNVVVEYNQSPNGMIRLNYMVMRIE